MTKIIVTIIIADSSFAECLELCADRNCAGAALDLSLWMTEWEGLVSTYCEDAAEQIVLRLNLRIQHTWALMALYLRALTASGIENVALMTEKQRSLAMAAKVSRTCKRCAAQCFH